MNTNMRKWMTLVESEEWYSDEEVIKWFAEYQPSVGPENHMMSNADSWTYWRNSERRDVDSGRTSSSFVDAGRISDQRLLLYAGQRAFAQAIKSELRPAWISDMKKDFDGKYWWKIEYEDDPDEY